jgi:chaperonin GroES
MKLLPNNDRVLVRVELPEEVTESGLIIPQSAQENVSRGIIEELGKDVHSSDGEDVLQKGVTVVYEKFKGTEVEHEGTKYIVLREEDIAAVLR